jgi:hypothetical protein
MIISLEEAQAKLPELIYNLKPGEEFRTYALSKME